jgi:hypothetical protein
MPLVFQEAQKRKMWEGEKEYEEGITDVSASSFL